MGEKENQRKAELGNFNSLINKWLTEAADYFEDTGMDEEAVDKIAREYYEPDLFYHIVDETGISSCGTDTNCPVYNGVKGRWAKGYTIQATRKPCPKCIKKLMSDDDTATDGEAWR